MSLTKYHYPEKMTVKKFLPVIHVLNLKQMLRNIATSKSNGADGVFLINHGFMSSKELIALYDKAVETYPDFWIGINCLDLSGYEVFQHVPEHVHGIWVDDGGVDDESRMYAKLISSSRKRSPFQGMYFGGVASRGQCPVENVRRLAKKATKYMDVITTSGPMTGTSASVDKIFSMKEAIGERSLALASGVTVDNVENYLPYVDYFLVATGISINFYELDPLKVMNLSRKIHDW